MDDDGINEIYYSGKTMYKTNKKLIDSDSPKLIFPFSSSYFNIFYTKKASGMLNMYMLVDSKSEADYIQKYTTSSLFQFVAKRYRKTSGFTPFVKNKMIPDLRGLDITNIEDIMGLTEKEKNYISNQY